LGRKEEREKLARNVMPQEGNRMARIARIRGAGRIGMEMVV